MNTRLCAKTNRSLEQNQDGILVNVFFEHESEADELERLKLIYPKSLDKTFNNKKYLYPQPAYFALAIT